jgi:hypothetical protein
MGLEYIFSYTMMNVGFIQNRNNVKTGASSVDRALLLLERRVKERR